MTNYAAFTINGTASGEADGHTGFDAVASQTLTFSLENHSRAGAGVHSVRFELPDSTVESAPLASLYASQLTFIESSHSYFDSSDPLCSATVVVPSNVLSSSYVVRCIVSTSLGEFTYDRIVAIRKGTLRHTVPAECGQYGLRGWSDAYNQLTKLVQDGIGGAFVLDVASTAETNVGKYLRPDGIGGIVWASLSWAAVLALGAVSGGMSPTLSYDDTLNVTRTTTGPTVTTTHTAISAHNTANGGVTRLSGADRAWGVTFDVGVPQGTDCTGTVPDVGGGPGAVVRVAQPGDSTFGATYLGYNSLTNVVEGGGTYVVSAVSRTANQANIELRSSCIDSGLRYAKIHMKGEQPSGGYATIDLVAGDGPPGNSNVPGYITLQAGHSTYAGGLVGGGINLYGGNGAGTAYGGTIVLTAGNATGSATGGGVTLTGGTSAADLGGAIQLTGGVSAASVGGLVALTGGVGFSVGGQASLVGGASGSGNGGTALVTGGAGGSGRYGGDAIVKPGTASGGTIGRVILDRVAWPTGSPSTNGQFPVYDAAAGDSSQNPSGFPMRWVTVGDVPVGYLNKGAAGQVLIGGGTTASWSATPLVTSISIGTATVATSGDIKLTSTGSIVARNAGNTADVILLSLAPGTVTLGDAANAYTTVTANSLLNLTVGAANKMSNSTTTSTVNNTTVDLQSGGTSRFKTNGTGIGFFNVTPVARPAVTGSRAGNAALLSLLTQGVSLGLWTDSTTA